MHFAAGAIMNLTRCIYVSREKGLSATSGLLKRAMIATVSAAFFWMVSVTFCGGFVDRSKPQLLLKALAGSRRFCS